MIIIIIIVIIAIGVVIMMMMMMLMLIKSSIFHQSQRLEKQIIRIISFLRKAAMMLHFLKHTSTMKPET